MGEPWHRHGTDPHLVAGGQHPHSPSCPIASQLPCLSQETSPTSSSPSSLHPKQGRGSSSSRCSLFPPERTWGVGGKEEQTTLSPVGEDFAVVEHLDLQDLVPVDIACHRPAEGLRRKDGREMSGLFQGAAAEVMGTELR